MSNRLTPRRPQKQSKATNQGAGKTSLGGQGYSETEQLRENVKQLGKETDQLLNQMREVLDPGGKAKGGRASGAKGKRRKTQRKRRKASEIDRRQVPPGQGYRGVGGGQEDEFDRVVAMLQSSSKTLKKLVGMTPPILPKELYPSISQSWHRADEGFKTAIATLEDKTKRVELKPKLESAGFTGEMLDMKETSLNYQMARVDKAILTYNNSPTLLEKFVRWIKPGLKVMNSVLGSLSTIPGVEVAKEFKEHLESAYEVVETGEVE